MNLLKPTGFVMHQQFNTSELHKVFQNILWDYKNLL